MSVLINGMKMPKDKPIRIVLNPNGQLFVDHGVHFTEYEAVELPPHGKLIDGDALERRFELLAGDDWNKGVGASRVIMDCAYIVGDAPAIIEVEDGT